MQYFQGGSGSVARLKWSSPSTLKQVIPQTQLTPAEGAAGTGLKGEYYSNTFSSGTRKRIRTDATLNCAWGGSTPGGDVPTSNWSARWTEIGRASCRERVKLCVETDDVERKYVNGSIALDHWEPQGPTEWCLNTPTILTSQHQCGSGDIVT